MSRRDVLCFSHLRWNFVFQRPNHLMVRFAAEGRVFYVEEPIHDDGPARLVVTEPSASLFVVTPHLPHGLSRQESDRQQRKLLGDLVRERGVHAPLFWFYTPMSLDVAPAVAPCLVVYDCMDELSAFHGAPPELLDHENRLFAMADLVFTGGQSLYESKRSRHRSVHAFPSSVDLAHFAKARERIADPADQAAIGHPRVGFFGVVDERMDAALLGRLAAERPHYQFVVIGPVVKIDPASLPRRDNIHYLGSKKYDELPSYLAGWDVATMPFALNEATRFISPTKTLEYLAADKPVVSTAIRDVVTPYGDAGIVRIADAASFADAVDEALACDREQHRSRAEAVLRATSWDKTWSSMRELIELALRARRSLPKTAASAAAQTDAADADLEENVPCSTI